MQIDDRPINPNKQYLQQKQLQNKQKKQLRQYLKKHQFNDQVLPCFRDNYVHVKKQKKNSLENQKSKAQIYEEIKRKNLEKFGDKKQEQVNEQNKIKVRKIDPLKMTIQYKPKSVFIDTNEYKLNYQQKNKQFPKANPKNTAQPSPNPFEQTAKQKYEKLLSIIRHQKLQLNQEKQNFQKHKQKLQFKKLIQKQNSVPFLKEIKRSIQQKKEQQQSHRVLCKTRNQQKRSRQKQQHSKNYQSQQTDDRKKPTSKKQNLSQIHSRIMQLQQQKQQIEQQVYKNKREIIDPDDVVCKRYSIQQVNQIPTFDIECFKDFIDLRTLHPQGNEFYKIAINVFQIGLNVKEAKLKLKVDNLDAIKQNSENVINSVDYKRRFQGQVRITKYNNGWVEVWNPGVQRLMGNKQLSYKVVWLRNGDIKQEWKDKNIQTYYSKGKEVIQVKFEKFQPIYFFVQLNQLEQFNPQKGIKNVMFRQGRIETFSTENDNMNGFSV